MFTLKVNLPITARWFVTLSIQNLFLKDLGRADNDLQVTKFPYFIFYLSKNIEISKYRVNTIKIFR